MAGYILTHVSTAVSPSTTPYSTVTDLLTVTAGHVYVLKTVKAVWRYGNQGGAAAWNARLALTDSAGANPMNMTPNVTATTQIAAAEKAQIVLDYTAKTPLVMPAFPGHATVAWTPTSDVSNYMGWDIFSDMSMKAGQILQFHPTTIKAAASTGGTTVDMYFRFDIGYIDYTI